MCVDCVYCAVGFDFIVFLMILRDSVIIACLFFLESLACSFLQPDILIPVSFRVDSV